MSTHKTVSLVLGSGGARGLAHIGVLRYLDEHDYQIKSIAGCSIGAMVGGIYAAGKLEEFVDWLRPITVMDIFRLMDLTLHSAGLVKGDRVFNTLRAMVGDLKIEDLPLPFTAVATDLVEHKEIWLSKGSLFDAIRASVSLPFFLTPVHQGDKLLLDGGILNPVPIAPTFHDDTDLTLAVNLGGLPDPTLEKATEVTFVSKESDPVHQKIISFIESLRSNGNGRDEPKGKYRPSQEWGMQEIALQSFDAMQGTIARQKLAAYPPDIELIVPRNACRTLEFHRADEMIELGYQLAREHLG